MMKSERKSKKSAHTVADSDRLFALPIMDSVSDMVMILKPWMMALKELIHLSSTCISFVRESLACDDGFPCRLRFSRLPRSLLIAAGRSRELEGGSVVK